MSNSESPIVILLENPKYGGNIGMVCRLIANFGLEPLRIISSQREWKLDLEWMAYESQQEIEKITYFETVGEARKDLDILIGTSMKHSMPQKTLHLPEISEKSRNRRTGILFGREDNGISREAKEICDYLVDFQLPGYQKSMNVSQSVAYVLGSLQKNIPKTDSQIPAQDSKFKVRFYERVQEIFGILGMNEYHDNEYLAVNRFKSILEKSNISEGDYNFLYRMFQEIENLKRPENKIVKD